MEGKESQLNHVRAKIINSGSMDSKIQKSALTGPCYTQSIFHFPVYLSIV